MKFVSLILFSAFIAWNLAASGQYAPAAGTEGSDAIHADSSAIKAWASASYIKRGLQQAGQTDKGFASSGIDYDCTGKADNISVSLGDGGEAVVKFPEPVRDIAGNDFAVFENSFDGKFLELAFVEVSSDSIRWIRFPSVSLTPATNQIGTFDLLNPVKIDNLAGKYQALYGTPFDLSDIKDSSGIDLNNIKFIRIIDVVGSVSGNITSLDSRNNPINDPWPTPFPQSGFDLDAVAILRSVKNNIDGSSDSDIRIFPNPAVSKVYIICSDYSDRNIEILNSKGIVVLQMLSPGRECELDVSNLPKGLYFVKINSRDRQKIRKLIIG